MEHTHTHTLVISRQKTRKTPVPNQNARAQTETELATTKKINMNSTLQPNPNASYKRTAVMQRTAPPLATWGSEQRQPVRARATAQWTFQKLDQVCGTSRKP